MPMSVDTRGSSRAPTVSATQAPNENPAAHSVAPGYRAAMKSSAGAEVVQLAAAVVERAVALRRRRGN